MEYNNVCNGSVGLVGFVAIKNKPNLCGGSVDRYIKK